VTASWSARLVLVATTQWDAETLATMAAYSRSARPDAATRHAIAELKSLRELGRDEKNFKW
jgi:hypothetical protein